MDGLKYRRVLRAMVLFMRSVKRRADLLSQMTPWTDVKGDASLLNLYGEGENVTCAFALT